MAQKLSRLPGTDGKETSDGDGSLPLRQVCLEGLGALIQYSRGLPPARGDSQSTVALGCRLNQVDEVAAGVLKQDGEDWPHALWFTTEADAKRL